ncbi:Ff.00g031480.m01.CDS01 [Fusarium sp. VM40]|nr:Ff.00g031480.m01.CDS01 [Fusarium sp. VM40]
MLERTAATLESCSLQRVINRTSKQTRNLRTGFWQHGAAAIDISSALPGPTRTGEVETSELETKQLQSTLMASVLMLDFLYPTSTVPLLRRLYPELPNPQQAQRTAIVPRRRAYSSITSPNSTETTTSDQPDHLSNSPHPEETDIAGDAGPLTGASSRGRDQPELEELQHLVSAKGRQFQQAWDLYSVIDNDQRVRIRGQLVQYLSRSHNIVETGRALSVFRQIPMEQWTNEVLSAGIILLLRSGDLPSAVKCFKNGAEKRGFDQGLEYLMADTINSRKWAEALDVWTTYYTHRMLRRQNKKSDVSIDRLLALGSIPRQGDLYYAFRAYLVGEGANQHKKIKQDVIASKGLSAFRKFFATMALTEPCPPAQATVILENLRDTSLYNTYIEAMLDRWYAKQESRSTMEQLVPIYQKFRELPDAAPAMAVYRGMFKINFPKNNARLEELHGDWIRFKGGLNQWGYEKFLKYYSWRGDVPAVKKLWTQYVEEFPEVLQSPRAFRSTMNVYAQLGDVEKTRQELDKMVNEYNIPADIDSWNSVMKAYMRTNDYAGVLDVFDEISSQHQPDSFTYAHAMAMSAKKGDLETTLEFFNKSQEANVELTKEMGLALVVAYCQNSLLSEAESLCIEMTHRKLTSEALWNQLINFNGVEGRIDKVYELLRRMRETGVEWDDETYGFLLQALVKVNQIPPAYTLLKRGLQERLFLITPEHFAIVMAGAARVGEYQLVESLYLRLQKSELPVTFGALVALVMSAAKRTPGTEGTKNLGKELVEYFRQAAEATQTADRSVLGEKPNATDASNLNDLKAETAQVGRAISLLVELREFGSVEELMSLFVQVFPQYQSSKRFPPDVVSALMYAQFRDEAYDKVIDLWDKTWESVYADSRKRSGDGILPGTEYDLSRIVDVVARTYREQEDADGLSRTVDKVVQAGFKLTRQNWARIVRDLSDMGKWERAMYWCETLLMPNWQGWNERAVPRLMRNTHLLKPPKYLIFRLLQKWLEMRKMAAWSGDVSRVLSTVEEKYPRLYHAFITSEVEEMPTAYVINGKEVSASDLDKVLQTLSYHSLMKVKEAMLRDLRKEKKRETSLGITPDPEGVVSTDQWKKMLHDKVRSYAFKWYSRRKDNFLEKGKLPSEASMQGDVQIEVKAMGSENPDDHEARKRFAYWNKFWDRYDQRDHGMRTPGSVSKNQRHGALAGQRKSRVRLERQKQPLDK